MTRHSQLLRLLPPFWTLIIASILTEYTDPSTDIHVWELWSNLFYATAALAMPLIHTPQPPTLYTIGAPICVAHIAAASFTSHRSNSLGAKRWDKTAINIYAALELSQSTHPLVALPILAASPFIDTIIVPTIIVALVLFLEFAKQLISMRFKSLMLVLLSISFTVVAAVFFWVPNTGVEHGFWHLLSAAGILTIYASRIVDLTE